MKSNIFDITGREIEIGDKVKVTRFKHASHNSQDLYCTEPQVSFWVTENYFEEFIGRVDFKKGSYCIELTNEEIIYFHEILDYTGEELFIVMENSEIIDFAHDNDFITDIEHEYYLNVIEDKKDEDLIETIYELLNERIKKECNKLANSFLIEEKVPSKQFVGKPLYIYQNQKIYTGIIDSVTSSKVKDTMYVHYSYTSKVGNISSTLSIEELNLNEKYSLHKEILLYKYKDQLKDENVSSNTTQE